MQSQPLCCNIEYLAAEVKRNFSAQDQLALDLMPTEPFNYHSVDRRGFFVLFRPSQRPSQRSFLIEHMPDVLRVIDPKVNTYMSMAEFYKRNRRVVNMSRVGAMFIDLDTYNIPELQGMDHQTIIWHIMDAASEALIPRPSCIMYSGRGYYIKWFLSTPVPRFGVSRWAALQRALFKIYQPLGADRAALDASRVLRLETTINTKSGEHCRVLWPLEGVEPVKYGFDYLCNEVFEEDREQIRANRQARLLKLKGAKREARRHAAETSQYRGLIKKTGSDLNWARLEDLRKLVEMRGPVQEGERDLYLYLAASFMSWTITDHTLGLEVEEIVREFCPTLPLREAKGYAGNIIKRHQDALKGIKYKYKDKEVDPRLKFRNSTLIELLRIESHEEVMLKSLISKTERKRRQKVRNDARSAAAGRQKRAEYESNTARRRIIIEQKWRQGIKASVIAKEVGVSKRLVYLVIGKCAKS